MKNKTPSPFSLRYFPIWLLLGLLWLIIQLPYRWQLVIGTGFGKLAFRFAKRERRIAEINLKKCFPEWSDEKRLIILKESFISQGIGLLETALGWMGRQKRLQGLARIHNQHYLDDALKQGKGALLFTAHFSSIHLAGRLMTLTRSYGAMFFPQKNPVLQWLSWRAMRKHYQAAIARDDARGLIRALKNNVPIWYTPDVDGGKIHNVFAPFFNIPTSTFPATSRFAKLTGAPVIPCFYCRREDNTGYEITFYPPLENFPTEDLLSDTIRINHIIETAVCKYPEQYLWQYKRFKTRPIGETKFY